MTLDEAIKYCKQIAVANEALVQDSWEKGGYIDYARRECAEEHRQLAEWLKELKSLRQKRPKGHWIMHERHRECSECKVWLPKDMPRNSFCPNCGTDMREVES